MHSWLLASVEVMEFHITEEHSKLRPNKVQYSNRRLYRVERLGSKLTSATPNCLIKCVIHMQVKIQFGVHIRGFTQFVIETEQASFYRDWENTGTVDLELYKVGNEPSMNTIYISFKQ